MAKAEELKVLDQIQELIQSTGADSYLAITFEGMYKIAQENIKNDYANSYQTLKESKEEQKESYESKIRALQSTIDRQQKELEEMTAKYEELESECQEHIEAIDDYKRSLGEHIEQRVNLMKELEAEKKAREVAEQEIIQLKAKCFDLMTASK